MPAKCARTSRRRRKQNRLDFFFFFLVKKSKKYRDIRLASQCCRWQLEETKWVTSSARRLAERKRKNRSRKQKSKKKKGIKDGKLLCQNCRLRSSQGRAYLELAGQEGNHKFLDVLHLEVIRIGGQKLLFQVFDVRLLAQIKILVALIFGFLVIHVVEVVVRGQLFSD